MSYPWYFQNICENYFPLPSNLSSSMIDPECPRLNVHPKIENTPTQIPFFKLLLLAALINVFIDDSSECLLLSCSSIPAPIRTERASRLEHPNNRSAAESTLVVCLLPTSSSDVHVNIVRCGSSTSSSDVWMTSSAVGLVLLFAGSASHSSSHSFKTSTHLLVECPQGHCPLWVCILSHSLTHLNLKIRVSIRYAPCLSSHTTTLVYCSLSRQHLVVRSAPTLLLTSCWVSRSSYLSL